MIARQKLADLLLLLVPLGGLTALAAGLGVAPSDSFRFGVAFAGFLLPGWFLSQGILPRGDDDITARFCLALFVSYTIYAACALSCRFLGWGYAAFGALFGLAFAVAAGVWWRGAACWTAAGLRRRWREIAVLVLAAILAAACFSRPYSDDIAIFEFLTLDSFEGRSFHPSALDVQTHGLSEAQPRMQANLLHALFGVLAQVADVSPRLLLFAVAPPFLGFFVPLALGFFVRSVTGPRTDPLLVLLGVIAPFSLFYSGFDTHWYEFQVLNSPALDKAFTGWVLLPLGLAFGWRYLRGGELRWLALVLAGLPALVWSHPMAPAYFLASSATLGIVSLRRGTWKRCLALGASGALAFAAVITAVDPESTQRAIPELASLDLAQGGPHLWPGHYTQRGHHEASPVEYDRSGRPYLKPKNFFGSGLVRGSLDLALVWIALHEISRRLRVRRAGSAAPARRSLPLGTGAAAVSCLAARLFCAPEIPIGPVAMAAGAAAAALGLALVAASAWRDGEEGDDPEEAAALRLQAAYASVLVLLWVVGSALLARSPHLAPGLSRTGWLYLGFFPFVYVAQYAFRLPANLMQRLPRSGARLTPIVAALPVLLIGLHVIDQALAIQRYAAPVLMRLGVGSSVAAYWWHYRGRLAEQVAELDAGKGARAPFTRPAWLRDGDRVLLPPHDESTFAGKHEVMKHSVFYREMFAEASAYQALRFAFLESFAAYNDFSDGRLTPRLLHWLARERVTVVMWVPNSYVSRAEFDRLVAELRAQWPQRVRPIAPGVHRIREAGGETP